MKPYEIIEHTADIGIRAYGENLEQLFCHMAQGLFSLIVSPEQIRPTQTTTIKVQAAGREKLLAAWLKDLLYLFDTRHFIGKEFRISRLESNQLEASISGETLDPARHQVDKEVKAVTYCDFQLQQDATGFWTAQVIFDI